MAAPDLEEVARAAASEIDGSRWRLALALADLEVKHPAHGQSFELWAKREFRLTTIGRVRGFLAVGRFVRDSPHRAQWLRIPYPKASALIRWAVIPGELGDEEAIAVGRDRAVGLSALRDRFCSIRSHWRSLRIPFTAAAEWARAANRARYLLGERSASDGAVVRMIAATFRAATEPLVLARDEAHPDDVDAGLARCCGCLSEDFSEIERAKDGTLWCRNCLTRRRRRRRSAGRSAAQSA